MNAWNLGTVFGIRIRIHWTFLLLPLWIFSSAVLGGVGISSAISTLIFVFAIFGCVLLHELGHALAARQFDIPTRDITLLPIGGVASLERMPRNPWQELWIAAAGPLVNVAIAIVLLLGLFLSAGSQPFLLQLAYANIALVVFNLIPAFPMDGGRILRSTLALFMDWLVATRIAVFTGKVAAIALGLFGLTSGNPMLIFIGVFVYFAAHSELVAGSAGAPSPNGFTLGRASRFANSGERQGQTVASETVPATLSVSSVVAWLVNRQLEVCRVVESGRTIGTISRTQLLDALARGWGNQPVGHVILNHQTG